MNSKPPISEQHNSVSVTLSAEPYISEEYARAEKDRLWKKVWQVACREEEIPNPGNYFTYQIHDQSIIIVRSGKDEISAYRNACLHRGRELTEGCGSTQRFHCKYHGWQWHLNGEIAKIYDQESFGEGFNTDDVRLMPVNVDRWGGFIFVNLNNECEPLQEFLDKVPYYLDQFDIGGMRYKWRKAAKVACNWKVAVEAFNEGYHAATTHPMLSRYGNARIWSRAVGLHSNIGQAQAGGGGIGTSVNSKEGMDLRAAALGAVKQQKEVCNANTTDSFIAAAEKLFDVLPESASPTEVSTKLMEIAHQIDAERGVSWPEIDREKLIEGGINWNVFPNTIILPNVTFCLGFRARPDGTDPDSCLFEVFALERYPKGEEPKPEIEHEVEFTEERWGLLLAQDFGNMPNVQKGLKTDGLVLRPNPYWEASIINFQRSLAKYMGSGGPKECDA
ncbi:aromatic ring-hydroxylating dioxygenase subunit alpha [Halioxenophilus sp. WMMB6]|uniref:aromatic ring-hydroxylating oxygenase subunit alpha n=1 Tax=Halioxenophilus sp. WMMB6 TaxID=3073815 RepID=UPI00295F4E2A|nr:aromatic ring-hydroxylating dioxygenase subunit alpha [Halioxenophilus sp. WMMB6]